MSTLFGFVLVLTAAVLHATWNAWVKVATDRFVTFAVVSATGALLYLPIALWEGSPGASAIRFLVASGVIHVFYFSFLLFAYAHGDLGQVYPIARGVGPMVVAVFTVVTGLERLSLAALGGASLVSVGVMALSSGAAHPAARRAVRLALATGLFIGAYTLADGFGVRAARSELGYIAWLHVAIGLPFASVVLVQRRRTLRAFLAQHGLRAAGAGCLATLAYSLVIWAMKSSKLAGVAALREVSVLIAVWIGTAKLGEPFGARRAVAAGVVVSGIAVLAFSR